MGCTDDQNALREKHQREKERRRLEQSRAKAEPEREPSALDAFAGVKGPRR